MPSLSAIFCASAGCDRPENNISRREGPRSIQCSGLSSALVSATSRPGRRVSSVVAVSTEISLFRDLPRREPCQRFGRHIICDVRAARNPRVVPDLDRCLEPIVNAGPDVPTDACPSLWATGLVRVVRGDVPGGDLRALADLAVLDLDEGARLGARRELRSRSQVTEWPDLHVASDLGVDDDGVGADLGP